MKTIIVIVAVYYYEETKRFLNNLNIYDSGIEYDLCLVVNNKEPDYVTNRNIISNDERDSVLSLVNDFEKGNKNIIIRDNKGEDIGAFKEGYEKNKGKYKYYFFINSPAIILCNNWLLNFYSVYEKYDKVGAIAVQVGNGRNPPKWYIKTTWWSMRNEVIDKMIWAEPNNRIDCINQEHDLFYPHVKSMNFDVAQVDDITNSFKYIKYGKQICEPITMHEHDKCFNLYEDGHKEYFVCYENKKRKDNMWLF